MINNMKFERLMETDIETLNSIIPDNWTSIVEIHSHYLITKNCHSIKVIIDNQIAGIGTAIVFNKTGWLAHIIVAPEYQNRGVGSAIVKNRIEELTKVYGCKTITLTATDQGYPVYKKFGFVDDTLYIIMERNNPVKANGTSSHKIRKMTSKDYASIYELDRGASGEDRFDLLNPVIDQSLVYEENKRVLGYYLPDFGDGAVIAKNEEAGLALLNERIRNERKIYIPEENSLACQFLLTNGYKEVKRINRMILGESFYRNPRWCYARVGGFAG